VSKKITGQRFGGSWSLLKIETVAAYLKSFNTALQQRPSASRPFHRVYIDAFAGSGDFSFSTEPAPLLDQAASMSFHAGSAKRALETIPSFDSFVFIERLDANVEKLKELTKGVASAAVIHGDANSEVRALCAKTDWLLTRGVIFLDPFGAEVDWETLSAISRTKALDVWYLFPLSGLYRNAPHDPKALDEAKRRTLTRILGTDQ
jgi:three-Cys-motif partner protein